jgi:hypothetical protein
MQFWNKEIETLNRAKLRDLQLERLKKTLRRVYQKVPHNKSKFKQANVKLSDIRNIEDINKLPFTTKKDLYVDYPFGLVTLPIKKLVRLHTSSGTTGKPKAIFFSKKDINTASELVARCLVMSGARPEDILQNCMTYGLFTGVMKIKQLSVFLENKKGRLYEALKTLAEVRINIRALSIADTFEFGILIMIVTDLKKAKEILENNDFTVKLTNVIAIAVKDKPGGLAEALKHLYEADINIEYIYAFVEKSGEKAVVVLRTENLDKTISLLQDKGVKLLVGMMC